MLKLSNSAQSAITRFLESSDAPQGGLRIAVTDGGCSGMQYAMSLEAESRADDTIIEFDAFQVFVDSQSAPLLQGISVDYLEGVDGSGFKFENPNATAACGCGKSFSA